MDSTVRHDDRLRMADSVRTTLFMVGASRFDDPDLSNLPAVANNVESLAGLLTSESGTRLPPDHCVVLGDEPDLAVVGDQLERFAEEAQDLLLVYYAGHGLLDGRPRPP